MKLLGSLLVALATIIGVNVTTVNVVNAQGIEIAPLEGPRAGGTEITVSGDGINAVEIIHFNGESVSFDTTAGSLVFLTPPAGPDDDCVWVQVEDSDSVLASEEFCYEAFAEPTLTGISPDMGDFVGEYEVTLTGTNFVNGGTTVTVDGVDVDESLIVFESTTSLRVEMPWASGTKVVDVTVTTGGGMTTPVKFTYYEAPDYWAITPDAGPLAGGQTVTLEGTGFVAGHTSIHWGSPSTVLLATVLDSNTLTFVTPTGDPGDVGVAVNAPGGTSDEVFVYTYFKQPVISSISATTGPTAGGTPVVISIEDFSASVFYSYGATVTLDGTPAPDTIDVIDEDSITIIMPPGSGSVDIGIRTPGGDSLPRQYVYSDIPTATSLSPLEGPAGTVVTINGALFTPGTTAVEFGNVVVAAADVSVNSEGTSLTVTAPDVPADGPVDVIVSTGAGDTGALTFTYKPATPTISFFGPSRGERAGGETVVITGTGFIDNANTKVTFGGVAAEITEITATTITVKTPAADAVGYVDVVVTTDGGTDTADAVFTYDELPSLLSVTPTAGPAAGGQLVTITGDKFVQDLTVVTFGGIAGTDVTVSDSGTLTVTTPSHAAGPVTVRVSVAGRWAEVNNAYTFLDAPTISSAVSSAGPTAGGSFVTVSGSGFVTGATSVTIGGTTIPADSVTVNSATSLSFTTPAQPAGAVALTVTTAAGTSAPLTFTYLEIPTVGSLNPAAGPPAGGTLVTLSGSNFFAGATTVTIGGIVIPAGSVTVASSNSLSFSTPPHATGNVAVSVTTPGGSTANVPGGFLYVDAPTAGSAVPTSGPTAGGTSVTVTGSNFVTGATSISIGSAVVAAADVTVNSPNSLTFTTPVQAAGAASFTITTPTGTTAPLSFTYLDVPTAGSLNPPAGPTAGGTTVTISGSNFVAGETSVTIGGTVIPGGSVTVASSTSLSFTTPAHADGNVAVSVTTPGGTSTNVPDGFTYTGVPTASALTPPAGTIAGGDIVSVTGSGFVANGTEVVIGGVTVDAEDVTVNSPSSLSFETPAHAAGNVAVTVRTIGGTSAAIAGGFTYLDAPSATELDPPNGPAGGGITVTITGSDFIAGSTSVKFGTSVTEISDVAQDGKSLTMIAPDGAPGATVLVTVTTPGGTSAPLSFSYDMLPAPVVTGLDPSEGPTEGGITVKLTGANFLTAETVTFGGQTATDLDVLSDTELTVTAPANAAGPALVIVTASGGSNTDGPSFIYVDGPPPATEPVFTSMNPRTGPTAGDTSVVITGERFTGATDVLFGSVPAGSFTVDSETQITAVSPPGTGIVDVLVVRNNESSTASTASKFTYADIVAPPQASIDIETVQRSFSAIASRTSSQAITSAVTKGIGIGFNSGSALDVALESAFMAYSPNPAGAALDGIVEAEQLALGDDRWSLWLDTTGSGLIDLVTGSDSSGWQINVTGGMGLRLSESFLVGVVGGYERFAYTGTAPAGTLDGQGYSLGAYFGAKATANVLVDLTVVWTGLGYDVASGAAEGSFDASRWLMSGGLAGSYELGDGLIIKPSARLYALWEQQSGWTDSLSTDHAARDFGQARLSAGLEISRALPIADGWELVPNIGAFADVQASYDSATSALPQDGLTGRITTGVDIQSEGGASLSLGGEISGLGTDLLTWSLQGRAGAKF